MEARQHSRPDTLQVGLIDLPPYRSRTDLELADPSDLCREAIDSRDLLSRQSDGAERSEDTRKAEAQRRRRFRTVLCRHLLAESKTTELASSAGFVRSEDAEGAQLAAAGEELLQSVLRSRTEGRFP